MEKVGERRKTRTGIGASCRVDVRRIARLDNLQDRKKPLLNEGRDGDGRRHAAGAAVPAADHGVENVHQRRHQIPARRR